MAAGPPRPIPVRDGYERWSAVYDDDGNPLIAVEQPVFDELTGDVRGFDVLDVGCGTGRHALALAARGARVTAVDFSPAMLARARAKPGADAVRWVEHDLARPLPFAGAFDLVVSGLLLDHVPELATLFADVARCARPGAHAVVTTVHPAMHLRGVQARFIDPDSGERVLLESALHSTSDLVQGALDGGWQLERMVERSVDETVAAQHPRGQPYVGWPILLALALRLP